MRKSLKVLLPFVFFTILIVLAIVYTNSLVNFGLNRYGFSLSDIGDIEIDENHLYINELTLGHNDSNITARVVGLNLGFSLSPLALSNLTIEQLDIIVPNRVPPPLFTAKPESLSLLSILKQLEQSPLMSVDIHSLTVDKDTNIKLKNDFIDFPIHATWSVNGEKQVLAIENDKSGLSLSITKALGEAYRGILTAKQKQINLLKFDLLLAKENVDLNLSLSAKLPIDALMQLVLSFQPGSVKTEDIAGVVNIDLNMPIEDDLNLLFSNPWLINIEMFNVTSSLEKFNYGIGNATDFNFDAAINQPVTVSIDLREDFSFSFDSGFLLFNFGSKSKEFSTTGSLSDINCYWSGKIACKSNWKIALKGFNLRNQSVQLYNMQADLFGQWSLDEDKFLVDINSGGALKNDLLVFNDVEIRESDLSFKNDIVLSYRFDTKGIYLATEGFELKSPQIGYSTYNSSVVIALSDLEIINKPFLSASFSILVNDIINSDSEKWFPLLSMNSMVRINSNTGSAMGSVNTDQGVKLVEFDIKQNISIDQGTANIVLSIPEFNGNERTFSKSFLTWPYPWDIQSGLVSGSMLLTWKKNKNDTIITGYSHVKSSNLAGFYQDSVFTGLSGQGQFEFASLDDIATVKPACFGLDLLDIGLPITNLSTCFDLDMNSNILLVDEMKGSLLGGEIETHDFSYDLESESGDLEIRIDKLQLEQVVALASYDSIIANGALSGYLPVSISSNGISMEAGRLSAQVPGGVIKYLPKEELNLEDVNPAIQLVNEALKNYQYNTMQVGAKYTEKGDLELAVEMKGKNPDMNNGQQINLNLNVSDNIPVLLKSLQSSRMISDLLEKRLPD